MVKKTPPGVKQTKENLDLFISTCIALTNSRIYSAPDTEFCHRDFVLKYVVIGEKKDFQEESGLFRDLFWSRSGPFVAICTKMQNCLK